MMRNENSFAKSQNKTFRNFIGEHLIREKFFLPFVFEPFFFKAVLCVEDEISKNMR